MQAGSMKLLLAVLFAAVATPAFGSIEGTYSGNVLTGQEGGAAYSYIHESTSAKKMGDANYYQKAGGNVLMALDNRDSFNFTVEDVGMDGLGAGDKIHLNFELDLLKFDGSLNTTNDLLGVVATLKLEGTLTVGGNHSANFSHGIHNITAADTDPGFAGLDYTIEVTSPFSIDSHNFVVGDEFTGDLFVQSGALAGPFNGIDDSIAFAIWGDSRNMDGAGNPNNTGQFDPAGAGAAIGKALGFDIYIEAQIIPEASSIFVWSLLTYCVGMAVRRRNAA